MAVSTDDLKLALNWIGTPLNITARQALVVSGSAYLEHFDIHPGNRNIDHGWVQQMKSEIVTMTANGEMMILTVAIDFRDIMAFVVNREEMLDTFKAIILDGQHRWQAFRELYHETGMPINFYVMVYLVNSDEQIKEKLMNLNKCREFTKEDAVEVSARVKFLQVWEEVAKPCEHRRCIRRIKNSKRLRSVNITNVLAKMTPEDIRNKLFKIAALYYKQFQDTNDKFKKSVPGQVITSTKLYQLSCDDDAWLDHFYTMKDNANA